MYVRAASLFRKGNLEGGLGCLLWSEFEGGVGTALRLFLGLGVEVWGGLKGGEEAFGDGGAGEVEEVACTTCILPSDTPGDAEGLRGAK